jgi:hypothetical protein
MDSPQSPLPSDQGHERDVFALVSKEWPTAELVKAAKDSLRSPPPSGQHSERDVIPLAPKDWSTAEEARSSDPGRDIPDQCCIEMAGARFDFSAGLRALEPPIRVFPRPSGVETNQFANNRLFRTLASFFAAALIGFGASFAWHYHVDEAKKPIRTGVPLLSWFSFFSTTKSSSAPAPAASQRLDAVAAVRHSVKQLAAKQEKTSHSIATLQAVEQDTGSKISSPRLQARAKLTPPPETRPATIEGWTLREVTNGTAVLEGPNGIWRAKRGDTVPGVGRVDSIVRWGSRWIVATSRGLVSTP